MVVVQAQSPTSSLAGRGTGGFLEPTNVLAKVGVVEPGDVVADFGSGAGYFSLALARKVGDTGKVYAVDVLEEPLQIVRNQAKALGVRNIETIRANLEETKGSGLRNNSLDGVWLANVLFQSQAKEDILQEAARVLKKGGYLVLVDWVPKISLGPEGLRFSPQEAIEMLDGLDVELEKLKEFEAGNYHWGLAFIKR